MLDIGDVMEYCSNCGKKLPEDAYFCLHCGVRTRAGREAGVSMSTEEWKETFARVGQELEKAFSIAGKEIEKAFKTARENVRQSTKAKTIVCSNCGATNTNEAAFCFKCGKKLE
jgi:uncharacterized membrane protein YvbJ